MFQVVSQHPDGTFQLFGADGLVAHTFIEIEVEPSFARDHGLARSISTLKFSSVKLGRCSRACSVGGRPPAI